jgi:hypothetical protein
MLPLHAIVGEYEGTIRVGISVLSHPQFFNIAVHIACESQ